MILVTGANGSLGSQTIEHLIEQGYDGELAGLVRSEEKGVALREMDVELRIGDYTDYDSMLDATEGIDTLLLISSSSLEGRVQQHRNVVEAAAENGVERLFYTSIVQADRQLSPLAPDHHETEKLIRDSGMTYTIYRNTFYGEFLPLYLGNALETGDWYHPSGGNEINLALRSEMAEALANGLSDAGSHENETYEITSGKSYTLEEIAGLLSEETGREIAYHDIPVADFKKSLEEAGLPDGVIMMSTAVARTFVNGGVSHTDDALEMLLGRPPAVVEDFLPDLLEG